MCSLIDILVVCVGILTAIIAIVAIFFGFNIFKLERGVNSKIKSIQDLVSKIEGRIKEQEIKMRNIDDTFTSYKENINRDIFYDIEGIGGASHFRDCLVRFAMPYPKLRWRPLRDIVISIELALNKMDDINRARSYITSFYELLTAINESGVNLAGYIPLGDDIIDDYINGFVKVLDNIMRYKAKCLKELTVCADDGIDSKLEFIITTLEKMKNHPKNNDKHSDGE